MDTKTLIESLGSDPSDEQCDEVIYALLDSHNKKDLTNLVHDLQDMDAPRVIWHAIYMATV